MNARTFTLISGFALAAVLGWTSGQILVLRQSHADDTPVAEKPAAKPCDVAMIDIGKVFKEHVEFFKAMEALKVEMTSFQEKGRAKQEEHKKLAEAAKSLKEGTEPRRQEDARIQRLANELQIEAATKQSEIMAEEARVYYRTYKDISESVAGYARAHGIRAVLRYNSNPADPADRNSVLQAVNNSIIFQDDLDITDEIIRRVNNLPAKS